MATFFLTIRGDQIGRFTSINGTGNGAERVVTLSGTSALGSASDTYTIRIDQAASTATQFANGQLITILRPDGSVLVPQTSIQPDAEQGLGAGDQHLILGQQRLFIDLAGVETGSTQFSRADEAAITTLGDNDGELDFADTTRTFPCFAPGTRIETPDGPRLVEALSAGDVVRTLDAGDLPIVWIAGRQVRFAGPDDPQRPVRFAPGSLAPGEPRAPLTVSPQHRVRLSARSGPALAPAKAFLGQPGVRVVTGCAETIYFAILLPRHALLRAEGAVVESFLPRRHILSCLPPEHRAGILACLPQVAAAGPEGYGPPALPILTVQAARRLLAPGRVRHAA